MAAMIAGRATAEGTERYRRRFEGVLAEGHFHRLGDLWLSSIGLGTYLGEDSEAVDAAYEEAVIEALAAGCNVLDTAINYRHQRSERTIGRALDRAIAQGVVSRDELFVSTKGGFLPFEQSLPPDPRGWLERAWIDSGLLRPEEIASGCHAIAPRFLADQLARSRANLGLDTVDLYYLHNPEMQLEQVERREAAERLRAALAWAAGERRQGTVAGYGLATWDGLRSPRGAPGHIDLAEVAALLPEGESLTAVQLPLNLAMPEALARPTQGIDDATVPAVTAARYFELGVFTSASLLQGRLQRGLPAELSELLPGLANDAQRALQFARSAPGVTTALVGMGSIDHVRENLAVAERPPADPDVYRQLFGGR
jgi:aryl-alcohol dehydrogenase-like predicted oxidoreductase